MGLFQRLRRITAARIEAFLTTMEDPEVLFPQLIKEMEEQVGKAAEAEAKAKAVVKGAERDRDEVKEKLEKMEKGAEAALSQGDEPSAREAVAAQIGLEADLKRREESVQRAQAAADDAQHAREQITGQLEELKTKKNEILTRARVAKTQQKIEKTVHGPAASTGSILDAVERLETQVEEAEAELDVRRDMDEGGAAPSLEKRLDDLEKDAEIDKRLASLKKKVDSAK
jgi:phage shock protein A